MTFLGLGSWTGAAVAGAPCSGTVGSAGHRPCPHGQAVLIRGQAPQVPAEDPSPPVLTLSPLPTVRNKATTPSLQDPERKTTSSCSTLSHHAWGRALWAHARRWGANSTLCWLSPCWSLVGCAAMELRAVLSSPLLPTKKWSPLANFTPFVPVGDSHHKLVAQILGRLGAPSASGWCQELQGTQKTLPHSSSAQPVPLLSHPQMGPDELQCGTQGGPYLEKRSQGGKSWGLMEAASLTSVSSILCLLFGRMLPWARDGSMISSACAGVWKDSGGRQFPARPTELWRWFRGEG